MSTATQQEVLQELSDQWKHRNDAPTPAKTGKTRRGKPSAAGKDPEPRSESADEGKEAPEKA